MNEHELYSLSFLIGYALHKTRYSVYDMGHSFGYGTELVLYP